MPAPSDESGLRSHDYDYEPQNHLFGGRLHPRIRLVHLPVPHRHFEFPTVVGGRYVIERKATLNDPEWIETEVRTGTGGTLQFTRPTTAGSAFFRLRVE